MQNQNQLPKGFYTRAARMDDLDAVLDLINFCSQTMIGGPEDTRSSLENDWTTPGFNRETDHLVIFSPDDLLVGYIVVFAVNQPPIHPWVWGRVHPDYEGLGLGRYLQVWGEHRARLVLEKVPDEARVSYFSGSWDSYQPANSLLAGFGMELIRHSFQMRVDLSEKPPDPQWPEGITVRTFRMEDLEAVYRADEEAFQDHFGHLAEEFETGLARFRHRVTSDPDFDATLWFLAMERDQIAGFSLCRKKSWEDEQMGWVSILGVRQPWRQRGLGLALLHKSFSTFWERGKRKVGLGVDAENLTGALRLYEKAGMYVHRKFNLYEKELRPGKELANFGKAD
jgi:mycothiol synthase